MPFEWGLWHLVIGVADKGGKYDGTIEKGNEREAHSQKV